MTWTPVARDDSNGNEDDWSRRVETLWSALEGQYEGIDCLSSGGYGEVWLARQITVAPPRPVALKIVFRDAGRTLEREGVAGQFAHPNIARVYEGPRIEPRSGLVFLACELVGTAETLRERLDNGPLAPREAVRIAREIASALEYLQACDQQIVHRDIKPENILFGRDGEAQLIDFGLAIPNDGSDPTTRPLGTTGYASPEQCGPIVTSTSDLYSLGVVLGEMLTGDRRRIVEADREITPELADLVQRLRSVDPSRRTPPTDRPAKWVRTQLDEILVDYEKRQWEGLEGFGAWLRPWFLPAAALAAVAAAWLGRDALFGLSCAGSLGALFLLLRPLEAEKAKSPDEVATAKPFRLGFAAISSLWVVFYGWGLLLGDASSRQPDAQLIQNLWNNASSCLFLILYLILHERIGRRRETLLPVAATLAAVALLVLTALNVVSISVGGRLGEAHASSNVFAFFVGVFAAVSMAMLFSRFESRFLSPPYWVKVTLYAYAAIQPSWVLLSDLSASSATLQLASTVAITFALFGKAVLVAFVLWMLTSGRLLFYLHSIDLVQSRVAEDWRRFRERRFE